MLNKLALYQSTLTPNTPQIRTTKNWFHIQYPVAKKVPSFSSSFDVLLRLFQIGPDLALHSRRRFELCLFHLGFGTGLAVGGSGIQTIDVRNMLYVNELIYPSTYPVATITPDLKERTYLDYAT
jgi:hypothetical protein